MGRYQYFESVSVFGIFVGIFKYRYWCRYFEYRRYRYRYFRSLSYSACVTSELAVPSSFTSIYTEKRSPKIHKYSKYRTANTLSLCTNYQHYRRINFQCVRFLISDVHSGRAGQPSRSHRRSPMNMAAADSNGYLKSMYMLNINNHLTKHYTYSYIHVRTFTKTEPVSLSNPTMQPRLLVKPVDGFKGFCCSNWT